MQDTTLSLEVRDAGSGARIVDVRGEITAASEEALMDAYARAGGEEVRAIVLNFSKLEYMNSGGIGLLVTLLVRATRARQKLLAFGLNEHYRQIFELTRLDEAISIHASEADAIAAAT
jgi:anti-sigma B factor antagonist